MTRCSSFWMEKLLVCRVNPDRDGANIWFHWTPFLFFSSYFTSWRLLSCHPHFLLQERGGNSTQWINHPLLIFCAIVMQLSPFLRCQPLLRSPPDSCNPDLSSPPRSLSKRRVSVTKKQGIWFSAGSRWNVRSSPAHLYRESWSKYFSWEFQQGFFILTCFCPGLCMHSRYGKRQEEGWCWWEDNQVCYWWLLTQLVFFTGSISASVQHSDPLNHQPGDVKTSHSMTRGRPWTSFLRIVVGNLWSFRGSCTITPVSLVNLVGDHL